MLESLIKVIQVITHMVQGYTHVTTDYQLRKGTMSHPHKLNLLSCIS